MSTLSVLNASFALHGLTANKTVAFIAPAGTAVCKILCPEPDCQHRGPGSLGGRKDVRCKSTAAANFRLHAFCHPGS